jgi:hypothetical protein
MPVGQKQTREQEQQAAHKASGVAEDSLWEILA